MVSKLDMLCRIVVPFQIRRKLLLNKGDKVEITEKDGGVFIKKVETSCAVCGTKENLINLENSKAICEKCVELALDSSKS